MLSGVLTDVPIAKARTISRPAITDVTTPTLRRVPEESGAAAVLETAGVIHSPQCLHFRADARIRSEHAGHGTVSSDVSATGSLTRQASTLRTSQSDGRTSEP